MSRHDFHEYIDHQYLQEGFCPCINVRKKKIDQDLNCFNTWKIFIMISRYEKEINNLKYKLMIDLRCRARCDLMKDIIITNEIKEIVGLPKKPSTNFDTRTHRFCFWPEQYKLLF